MSAAWRLSRVLQAYISVSCVQTADGLRVVEVPDEHCWNELLIPVLHVDVVQGSVGWQLFQWLIAARSAGRWNLIISIIVARSTQRRHS